MLWNILLIIFIICIIVINIISVHIALRIKNSDISVCYESTRRVCVTARTVNCYYYYYLFFYYYQLFVDFSVQ